MIIKKKTRDIDSNSLGGTKGSIQNSAKMFKLIISGLYSNKPESITREIWSNAFDEHTDRPFEIVFPSAMSPTFTCRDFGRGLSHEYMINEYAILGHSTKEDTNDAVGKWGVGRMSPLSYTDTFSVTSYHKGKVGYYSVQLDADGAPEVHPMALPTPTDQPDGLEVSFPVQRGDLNLFANAARRVALGFDVKPIVRNNKDFNWEPLTILYKGEGWYGYRSGYDSPVRGSFAKMGCVLYPIDRSSIDGLDSLQSDILNKGYVIDFDIGELEVTASREGLSYGRDEPTSESIKKKLKAIEATLEETILKGVREAPTYYDAYLALDGASSLPYQMSSKVTSKAEWKGEKVSYYNVLDPFAGVTLSYKSAYSIRSSIRMPFDSSGKANFRRGLVNVFVSVTEGPDRDIRAPERVRNGWGGKDILWVKVSTPEEAKKMLVRLKERLGETHTYTLVKDIPDPGPQVSGSRAKTKIKSVQISKSNVWDDYAMDDAEFNKGGIYLPISNNRVLDDQEMWFQVAKYLLKAKVLPSDNLIVVPKTHWKKFEEASNWKPLWSAAKEYTLKDLSKKKVFALSLLPYQTPLFTPLSQILGVQNTYFKDLYSKVLDPSVEEYNNLGRREMWKLLQYIQPCEELNKSKCVLTELAIKNILSAYPLLKMVNHFSIPEAKEYVQALDLLRSKNRKKELKKLAA